MITDILGSGGNVSAGLHIGGHVDNVRSTSPQGPRDLSTNAGNNHYMHMHHGENQQRDDDSDSDLSGQLDDNSSNGKFWGAYKCERRGQEIRLLNNKYQSNEIQIILLIRICLPT